MEKTLISVLEITQTHVKLVHAKSGHSGRSVVFVGVKEIKDSSNEIISKAVRELISDSKIKPTNLICVIARGSTIVRNLRLPSQDPAEIEDMLDFQIKQQIPYPKEDIISDYVITARYKDGYAEVLLVTAHKDVVDKYTHILNAVEVSPSVLSLSSVGIAKWYSFYRASSGKLRSEAVLLVNIDSVVTDLCFCSEGNPVFSRSLSFGINELNAEKIEGFLEQMHLTLTTYRKEKINPEVSRIVLLTQSSKATFLSQKLNLEFSLPVEIINPLANTPINKNAHVGFAAIGDVSLTAIFGLALGLKEDEMNLLPDSERKKQNLKHFKKELFFSGSLFILTVLVIVGAAYLNIYKKEQYLKYLDSK
ncbi:MAG: pilus assembly protein PilM, partial [Candidatus Omnitrophica bacterium]|nr:pilus assembly protein PilM [Candidatus Omnitrophota bacterium]